MVEVKRKKNESFEGLLRRFSRRLQSSGNALEARKIRFHEANPSKNALKRSALRRERIKVKRDYLMKTGQLVETKRKRRRR